MRRLRLMLWTAKHENIVAAVVVLLRPSCALCDQRTLDNQRRRP